MTAPAPSPQPPGLTRWPKVFDGIGALVVRCDIDPEQLVEKIEAKTGVGELSWIAPKVNGDDITPPGDIQHCVEVWRALGLSVGAWVWCYGPPDADAEDMHFHFADVPDFGVYDIESPYKTDAGAPASWPAELVSQHKLLHPLMPAAATSYGAIPGYGNQPSSINFKPFADAGWPMLAQAYDGYTLEQAFTYTTESPQAFPGPYPAAGVHVMLRSLSLKPGQAVYRPEGIDG